MQDRTLAAAADIIDGARNATYGDAVEEFERIAKVWGVLLGIEMDPADVPRMMVAMKLVRSTHSPEHTDHWVDIAGYAALAARSVEAARARP